GPNTGGMGVIAPNPYYTQQDADETMEKILIPTMKGFEAEGINFVGVLFLGLMMTTDGVKVIEYNCRPGDPETQTVLPLLDADLLDIITACMNGELHKVNIKWKKGAVCNVVAASGGYPGDYKTGLPISGLDNLPAGVHIIHAGTKKSDGALLTNGGRVLNIIAQGDTLENAHKLAYEAVQNVQFEGIYYRKDIGKI
ncbi:MAG: phosphoribosylamine--glycine ligase, partial [Defluviitaleaceae bacterium]|nr:phosphoribosylamine--glycine ligase [Defluviitaleaceae bacterium]